MNETIIIHLGHSTYLNPEQRHDWQLFQEWVESGLEQPAPNSKMVTGTQNSNTSATTDVADEHL